MHLHNAYGNLIEAPHFIRLYSRMVISRHHAVMYEKEKYYLEGNHAINIVIIFITKLVYICRNILPTFLLGCIMKEKQHGEKNYMNYKRTIKFQYYQIKSKAVNVKNAKYKLFNFAKWIDYMSDNNLIKVEISFNDVKARIDHFHFNSDKKIWGLRLFKLRNTNIPSRVKNNEDARVIELEDGEYLGEDLFLIYDQENGIALIQQNRFSLVTSRLEELFADTYNRFVDERNKIEVDIAAILDLDGKEKLRHSNYKNLEISFANINKCVLDENRRSLGTLLNPLKSMYGVNGSIKISLGHSKLDTLNRKLIQDIVKEVNEPSNKGYIKSAKIKIQEEEDSDVEVVDLFNDICDEYLEFVIDNSKGLIYSRTIDAISDKYIDRKDYLEKLIGKK